MTPLVRNRAALEAVSVSKRFARKLDYAETDRKRCFGAELERAAVHAVDDGRPRRHAPARSSAWSANPAAANRRSAASSPASCRRASGEVRCEGQAAHGLRAEEARAARLAAQMIFQDPMSSLNPRKRVLDIIGEAPVVHGIVTAPEMRDYVAELMRAGRPRSQLSRPLSAPVLRRPAAAHRHRPRAGGEAAASSSATRRSRRSTSRSRRRCSTCSWTCARIRPHLPVHQPRSRRREAYLATGSSIMYLGRVVESATAGRALRQAEPSLYPGAARRSAARRDRRRGVHADQGRNPVAASSAAGLPFPSALSVCFDRCREEAPALKRARPGHVSACHLNDCRQLRQPNATAEAAI